MNHGPPSVTRRGGLRRSLRRAGHHHLEYSKVETLGWKAIYAERRLSSVGWKNAEEDLARSLIPKR
jgi:hypothetical protein